MTLLLLVLVIVALTLACLALGIAVSAQNRAIRALQIALKHGGQNTPNSFSVTPGEVWVVVNPIKVANRAEFEAQITKQCLASGYPEPIFVDTTVDSPGREQARKAANQGASLVISAGGDGTLREVAAGLADTKASLGILPMGTGNLLARNLNLPFHSFNRSVEVALTGKDSWVDLGYLEVDDGTVHPFLVMAGIGFDGDIMAGTKDSLKDSIGWGAYFVSGIGASTKPASDVEVKLGEETEKRHEKVRSILFASCGELVGGLSLLPDANPHDGWLDIMFLSVRGWLVGWLELIGRVSMQAFAPNLRRPGIATRMDVARARKAEVHVLEGTREVQIDGDALGSYQNLKVELKHHALKVRVI